MKKKLLPFPNKVTVSKSEKGTVKLFYIFITFNAVEETLKKNYL